MGSQDMHRDDGDNAGIPDYPPPPAPGDLVAHAYQRHDDIDAVDLHRFTEGVRDFWTDWREGLRRYVEDGAAIDPLYLADSAPRVQREADRLESAGDPAWRLWDAYAEELREQEM